MSNAPRDARARRYWGSDDTATPILHVDMDSFFAQVEMAENPSLQGQPLIVGGTGARGVVTSATYEVRAAGVRAGMPTSRARALYPAATIVASSRHVYSRYSRAVMAILADITPALEQASVDEAFLDVSGARRRLGGPTEIGHLIRARIHEEVGLPASVGIASTKSVAKIASSTAKPDGLLLVPESATLDFLHPMPVGVIWGVGGKTGQILAREGIDTVGDLAHASTDRLTRLLGAANAAHLHKMAWGIDPRPVSAREREKSVGTEHTFAENLVNRSDIEAYILQAAHECAARLRRAQSTGEIVSIKLRDGDFRTITRSMTLPVPTDLGGVIARAAQDLFAKETLPVGGVRLVGVRVEGLRSRLDGVAVALDEDIRTSAAERAMDSVKEKFPSLRVGPATLMTPPSPHNGPESHGRAIEH